MKNTILFFGLSVMNFFCLAQSNHSVSGRLRFCYDKSNVEGSFEDFKVWIVDLESPSTMQQVTSNELGEFKFEHLRPSEYRIYTLLFGTSSTIVKVDTTVSQLILCVDGIFRPVPTDSLADFILKAKSDIEGNNLKLYRISSGLVVHTKGFYRRNRRLKEKFNFEIETVSCLLSLDRKSFIERQGYLAYNEVASEYLDKKFGTSWRHALK